MGQNIKKEQNRLEQMSIIELQERYHGLSSRRVSIKCKRWYIKRILWIIQAATEGDISEESRLLAKQIAAERRFENRFFAFGQRRMPMTPRHPER